MIRAKVREWVEHHALLPRGNNIVAACSGGADSLALVDLLDGFRQELGIALFVAHFEHGLRGEESCRDAEFVRNYCDSRGLRFFCGNADVKNEVLRNGGSIEEVARRLRYEYLRYVAGVVGGALIATGHHRDDQAETVLMNLVRGSGGRGLGAMRPRQVDIVRPLLCLTRTEIEIYCRERKLQPRNDFSNDDVNFRRNRVRHELVPLLQQRFNPSLTDALCRTADVLADEQEFLRSYVEEQLPKLVVKMEKGYRLNSASFSKLHVAVQRELLRYLLGKLRGDTHGVAFAHVEQIRALYLQNKGAQCIDLPGAWRARKSYQDLFIETTLVHERECFSAREPNPVILSCPGETILPEFGVTLCCSEYFGELAPPVDLGDTKVAFERASLQFPLFVRQRRPGDVFHSLGAPGKRKLKKLLIDLKIPVEQRDIVPIVSDGAGIIWVAGFRRAERGRLSTNGKNYIIIELIKNENTH